jgi:hypothetical protein
VTHKDAIRSPPTDVPPDLPTTIPASLVEIASTLEGIGWKFENSNPFAILGLHSLATELEVNRRYIQLCKVAHPDKWRHPIAEPLTAAIVRLKELSAGFNTIVQPHASAGASFHDAMFSG